MTNLPQEKEPQEKKGKKELAPMLIRWQVRLPTLAEGGSVARLNLGRLEEQEMEKQGIAIRLR